MKKNIRSTAKVEQNYSEINREERNYAAILFAALCKDGNNESFLRACGISEKPGPDFGIYFEYAYLRDIWSQVTDNEVKKEIIRQHLDIAGIDEILRLPIVEINRKFGVGGVPSTESVQFPGRWALSKYQENFPDNDDLLKISKFKWSFNIKPDIVIHLAKDRAVCIEAKYESGEGVYPAAGVEKAIFSKRGIPYVKQMELQKYMMEDLLGIRADFVFLVFNKEKSSTHRILSWSEAFGCLNLTSMPPFAIEMARRISTVQ